MTLDPGLVGQALAPPWRRAMALLVDLLLLALPTLAVAAGAAALALRGSDPIAWRALQQLLFAEPPAARVPSLMADLAPRLVAVDAPGVSADLRHAVAHADRRRTEALMADTDLVLALHFGDEEPDPAPGIIVLPLQRLIPPVARTLALFGVPALYFTLAHRGRRGATVGKRLLRIRLRRLDGRPLGLLASLDRFGGYFAVPATLGLALLDLWRDPLRQMGHDRGAGTVVVRVGSQAGERAAPPARPAGKLPTGPRGASTGAQ